MSLNNFIKKTVLAVIVLTFGLLKLNAQDNFHFNYDSLISNIKYINLTENNYNYNDTEYLNKIFYTSKGLNYLQLDKVSLMLLQKIDVEKIPENFKGKLYSVIAESYESKNDYFTADKYYTKAISIYKKQKDYKNLVNVSLKLANINLQRNEYYKALLFSNLTEDYFKYLNDSITPYIEKNIIDFVGFQHYNEEKKVRKSLSNLLNIKVTKPQNRFLRNINLAHIYMSLDNPDSAKIFLNAAANDSIYNLKRFYLTKALFYNETGNNKLLNNYIKKYTSLLNKEKKEIITSRNKLLNNDDFIFLYNSIREKESNYKLSDILEIIFLIILFIIFIVVLFLVITQKKSLKFQKKEVEKINEQKAKLKREIELYKSNQNIYVNDKISDNTKKRNLEYKSSKNIINGLNNRISLIKTRIESRNRVFLELNFHIRSLLSNVVGYSNMLKLEFAKKENVKLYSYSESIENSSINFIELMDIFADYVTILSGKIKAKKNAVKINEIINRIIDNSQYLIDLNKIKIIRDKDLKLSIYTDGELLHKILKTAILIAINNTNRGFINIKVNYEHDMETVTFQILNTGKGFDKAYLKDLMEAYNKEGLNYIPGYNGSAMEFPLIKNLLQILKGDYEVYTDIGKGIKQIITLPAKEVEADDDKNVEEINQTGIPWEGKKVLVVEDDQLNQILFKRLLSKASMTVISYDSKSTIEQIRKLFDKGETFDIILMDINLPGLLNGIELKNEIKKLFEPYNDVPFIAQTAYSLQEDKERFINEGFDEYIPKPIIKSELIKVVDAALKTKTLQ